MVISLVILTISQYKTYHELNSKIIHKMSILLAAETDFDNFAMPKGNIGHIPCKHWSIQWYKIYFEIFYLSKYILILFDWKIIILVQKMSGLKTLGWKYSLCSSNIMFWFLDPMQPPSHSVLFLYWEFPLRLDRFN